MYMMSVHPNVRDIHKHWLYTSNYQVKTTASLEELAGLMTRYVWCHSLFLSGKRSPQSYLSAQMLVLDYDNGYPLEMAKEDFKDYRHIIGVTKSHQVHKDGRRCDRFRVVLFFDHSLDDAVHAKQNFYRFIVKYNKLIKQSISTRIERYCQATGQNFKNWQAVDIGSSDIARKWMPFQYVVQINPEGKTVQVKPKVTVTVTTTSEEVRDLKFKYFNRLGISTDGRSYAIKCPACSREGGDKKGQNMSVRYSEGQYFYKCQKNPTHKIELKEAS